MGAAYPTRSADSSSATARSESIRDAAPVWTHCGRFSLAESRVVEIRHLLLLSVRLSVLLSLLLGACLTSGCATPPHTETPDSTGEPTTETWGKVDQPDLEYPERLGQFVLVEVDDLERVELGVRLKYADSTRPRAVIDAYVYPISRPESLSMIHVLEWEMRSVSQGMEYVARQQGWKAGRPAQFPFGLSGEDPPRGLGVKRTMSSDSDELESLAYLVVKDHRFFKLRITVPRQDPSSENDGYFQEVVDVLQPAIRLKKPFERPSFAITVYRNVFLAPQHESCNIAGWILYGSEMMMQIEAGNYRDTLARELAARKRALDYWRELRNSGEPCASDVLEVMSRVEEAGFLAEYVFESYGRGSWAAPEDLRFQAWKRWSRSNVEAHDPVVDPGIVVRWKAGEGAEESSTQGSPAPDR